MHRSQRRVTVQASLRIRYRLRTLGNLRTFYRLNTFGARIANQFYQNFQLHMTALWYQKL
jgi:hypothetical protein